MKIDEFIEKVNQVAYAKEDNNLIKIYSSKRSGGFNDWFLILEETSQGVVGNYDWDYLDGLDSTSLFYILGLVQELKKTPIEERFPEKKYVLSAMRYVEGPIAIRQYVTDFNASGDYLKFDFGSKEEAKQWTGQELHYLSQWFPEEAIDAMKEPVEEVYEN